MPDEYADHITVVFDNNHRLINAYVADADDNSIVKLPITGCTLDVDAQSVGVASVKLHGSRLWIKDA